MTSLWRGVLLAVMALVAASIAAVLVWTGHELILLGYILFWGAVILAVLVGRLKAALPPAQDFERLLATPDPKRTGVGQLRTIRQHLAMATYGDMDVHVRLRPLVRDIVAARLRRREGIDLDREPERAAVVLGSGLTWDLVRPDRKPPTDRLDRGWSEQELEQLLKELESL